MFLAILKLIGGLFLLGFGADWLVKGAVRFSGIFKISAMVVGLTVVAFGTSAPELAVSLWSSWNGKADIALGNIVGSNIFNLLVIIGVAGLITPLAIKKHSLHREMPILLGSGLLVFVFAWSGNISTWEGAILFIGLIAYIWLQIKQSKFERLSEIEGEVKEIEGEVKFEKSFRFISICIALILIGLGTLVAGSQLFVDGAVTLARYFGVSELVIGLTLVSLGTSLPELATSTIAALRSQSEIAVGNVVGSNIFNFMCVGGISALITPDGLQVSKSLTQFDLPFCLLTTTLVIIFFRTGYRLVQWEALILVMIYIFYILHLFGTNLI
ncbi:MAG: sodium:calcium antiporter [Deltaproteobacteria bacterium CG11_big_fil_rev_8_21_14_0_20_45_16]|nr:MAG: sodium:calcium antiporter [Deltaproteobacteria bacterium CG11_big_fil_rev_8_21_14_0_20_45_16]